MEEQPHETLGEAQEVKKIKIDYEQKYGTTEMVGEIFGYLEQKKQDDPVCLSSWLDPGLNNFMATIALEAARLRGTSYDEHHTQEAVHQEAIYFATRIIREEYLSVVPYEQRKIVAVYLSHIHMAQAHHYLAQAHLLPTITLDNNAE